MTAKSASQDLVFAPATRSDMVARVFVFGVWLLMALIASYLLIEHPYNVPLTEDWTLVPALTGNEPDLLGWLWSQNNEHRVPLPRLALLALLRLGNGDFRSGMYFNVISLSILALAMILVARRLRHGRTHYADAFFPVALLHLGNWENLYWSWQLSFVVSILLLCVIMLMLVTHHTLETRGAAVASGVSLLLLPFCGGTGLLFVPPLALWMGYCGLLHVTGRAKDSTRSVGVILLISSVLAVLVSAFYFVGYETPAWTPPNPGLAPSLQAAFQFLALGLGPAARNAWGLSILAVVLLIVPAILLLVRGLWRQQAPERHRALGIAVFVSSLALFTLAMGWGRAGVIAIYGSWPIRYTLLSVPALCITYYIWELYGPSRFRTMFQSGLLLGMLILLPENTLHGRWWADWYDQGAYALARDIDEGITADQAAERHIEFLFHSLDPADLADYMRMLKEANLSPFARLQDESLLQVETGALGQTTSPVTQEMRYYAPLARSVTLIWGLNGWQAIPVDLRPTGTVLNESGVMQTPMVANNGAFEVDLSMLPDAALDFGFLIIAPNEDGAVLETWDGDYQIDGAGESVEISAIQTGAILEPADTSLVIDRLISQEIRYYAPQASEVFLVWGINSWQSLPENTRPEATRLENDLMYTAMGLQGDDFVAALEVPAGANIDYAFQVTKTDDGVAVNNWDTNNGENYHTRAIQIDEVVRVQSQVALSNESKIIHVDTLGFLWLIVVGLAVAVGPLVTSNPLMPHSLHLPWNNRLFVSGRDLLYELVARDIKLRYRRSALGILWSLINPLLQLAIFAIVFTFILPLDIENYPLFLFTGLLSWIWLQSSLLAGTISIVENRDLVRRPGFIPGVLPVVSVTSNLVHFLLSLPVVVVIVLLAGLGLHAPLLALPLIISVQFVFTLALANLLAILHVNFRDTQHLVGVFLLLWFYLTPIFYSSETLPEGYQKLFALNPMLHIVNAYRDVFIYNSWPSFLPLLLIAALALPVLWLSIRVLRRVSDRFVEEL